MIDDWFRSVELKLTFDEFDQLPRMAGYKHEYFDGRCVLTPRPRNCYAELADGTNVNCWQKSTQCRRSRSV